jgi:hypothetical protein
MDRPLVEAWAALVMFVVVAVAAILLTNALISAVASEPSVTFSIVSTTPAGAATSR